MCSLGLLFDSTVKMLSCFKNSVDRCEFRDGDRVMLGLDSVRHALHACGHHDVFEWVIVVKTRGDAPEFLCIVSKCAPAARLLVHEHFCAGRSNGS